MKSDPVLNRVTALRGLSRIVAAQIASARRTHQLPVRHLQGYGVSLGREGGGDVRVRQALSNNLIGPVAFEPPPKQISPSHPQSLCAAQSRKSYLSATLLQTAAMDCGYLM